MVLNKKQTFITCENAQKTIVLHLHFVTGLTLVFFPYFR